MAAEHEDQSRRPNNGRKETQSLWNKDNLKLFRELRD
jgi:hypothetical protein